MASHDEMIRFIDDNRERFAGRGHLPHLGCNGLWVHHLTWLPRGPRPGQPRSGLFATRCSSPELRRVHEENYSVYGVPKMHQAMVRAGWRIGRGQVARLVKLAGVKGGSPWTQAGHDET